MMAHEALSAKLRETAEKLKGIESGSDNTPDDEEFEKDLKEMKELMTFHDKESPQNQSVQSIELLGKDQYGHSSIFGYEVNIHSSPSASRQEQFSTASNKVTVATLTSHNFDANDAGANQMVACNDKYVAYVLEGRSGHVLRVLDQSNGNRGLLKDFVGSVVDVSFVHFTSNVLACVDQGGNVYVWQISENNNKLVGDIIMQVVCGSSPEAIPRRLVWCPHVATSDQSTGEGEEDSLLLAVSHGSKAEVMDFDILCEVYGKGQVVNRSDITEGVKVVEGGHSGVDIHDIALAPDGNVMATAGGDGIVKFWNIAFESTDPIPNCLHSWTPHDGAPVTRLLFCDDQLHPDPSTQTFWRFLITSAEDTAEVKIWCTVSWSCLQTIRFLPPLSAKDDSTPKLLLNLDLSTRYCVVADSTRLAVYVLQLQRDVALGQASFTSIREYMLAHPVLSFVISGPVEAVVDDLFEMDGSNDHLLSPPDKLDDFDSRRHVVKIKLYAVQPRSVREMCIQHEPHDFLTHLPPPLKAERELDRRFELLSSDSEKRAVENSTDLDESFLTDFTKTSDDLDPLNPDLTPRPLLQSTGTLSGVAQNWTSDLKYDEQSGNDDSEGERAASGQDGFSGKGMLKEEGISSQEDVVSEKEGVRNPGEVPSEEVMLVNLGESPEDKKNTSEKSPVDTPVDSTIQELIQPIESHDTDTTLTSITSTSVPTLSGDFGDSHTLESTKPTLSAAEQSLNSIQQLLGLPQSQGSSLVTSSGVGLGSFLSRFSGPTVLSSEDKTNTATSELSSVSEDIPTTTGGEGSELDHSEHVSSSKIEDDNDPTGEDDHTPDSYNEWPDITDSDSTTVKQEEESVVHSVSSPEVQESEEAKTPLSSSQEQLVTDQTQVPRTESRVNDPAIDEVPSMESREPQSTSQLEKQSPQGISEGWSSTATQLPNPVEDTLPASSSPKLLPMMKGVKLGIVSRQPEEVKEPNQMTQPTLQPQSTDGVGNQVDPEQTVTSLQDSKVIEPQEEETKHSEENLDVLVTSREHRGDVMLTSTQNDQPLEASKDDSWQSRVRQVVLEQQNEVLQHQQQTEERMFKRIEALLEQNAEQQRQLMTEHSRQTQQQIDRLTRELKNQEKQKLDRLSTSASGAVQTKVEKVVKSEMKSVVVPALTKSIGGLADQVNVTVAQKVEAGVKDTVSKVVKSKALSDTIAANISDTLQPMVQAKFEDCFTPLFANMAGSFEKSCNAMCQQINAALSTGTAEYLEHLQQHLDTHQQTLGSGRDVWMAQVNTTLQKSNSVAIESQKRLSEDMQTMMQTEVQKMMQGVSDMVQGSLPGLVAAKVNECFEHNLHRFVIDIDQLKEEQKSKARDKAKSDVDAWLSAEQFGKAFDLALTRSDLPLVMYICKQINPEELFDQQPPPVSQAILLSLVHHLAADFSEDLDLKLKYIEQCILAIDDNDGTVREHIPAVLGHLAEALTTKEKDLATTQPAKARQIRKLRMVTERLSQMK